MSKNNELFLDLFKELETILRNNNKDYRFLEDSTKDDLEKNRLTICRQIRNYLSHQNDKNFIEISQEQIKFLQMIINREKIQGDLVKNHMIKISYCSCTLYDKCSDIIPIMNKRNIYNIPVISKDCKTAEIANIFDVSNGLVNSKTTKIKDIKTSKKNIYYFDQNTLMDETINLEKEATILITGKDNKIIGLLKREV